MLMRVAVVAVAAIGVASCQSHDNSSQPRDTPTIVPWRAIGAVALGTRREGVDHVYGAPIKTEKLKGYFPVGTRYYRKRAERVTYRVRGGELVVTYVEGRAKVLTTTSPRYRTPDGIHVHLRIKPHRCAGSEGCWREFAFDECIDSFRTSSQGVDVALPVEEGVRRVTSQSMLRNGVRFASISFGDPDVSLLCF